MEAFHAGLDPFVKNRIQNGFISGEIPVICATNAFGMGVDKSDIRLVVHADIPGSLENYLQEAGRAGRDQGEARCVLLYDAQDIENQFGMCEGSKLTLRDIQQILRKLRKESERRKGGKVVITAGEVLMDEQVSRQHAQIRQETGGAVIYDLNSTNGTFVNGKRITGPCPLRPGDVIAVGDTELVFQG